MEARIYTQEGKEAGTITLPESVFGLPWNADLVHQVVVSMESNERKPIAHTKNRGEVSGGGKKPWRQKGTGRARHGSRRSPIWRGGGTTFGPRNEKEYGKKVNKKMMTKALYTLLSRKLKNNELMFVNDVAISTPKTAQAKQVLTALSGISGFEMLSKKRAHAAYVALPKKDTATEKSFRNFGNVKVAEIRNINPRDVITYKYIVVAQPETAVAVLTKKLAARTN